jgi:hypothetical protein
MEETDHQKVVVDGLRAWLDALYDRAYTIVDAHWREVRAMEKRMPGWENKSELSVRCARSGNALKLEWARIRWAGSKTRGTRTMLRETLRKQGYGYSIKTLLALSKDWERPLVENTEMQLMAIRREWRHITTALRYIRFAKASAEDQCGEEKRGE